MGKRFKSCLNETRIMKNGMKATCVAYRSSKDIDILFEDGTLVEHVQKHHFFDCVVSNPNSNYNPNLKLSSLKETNPELMKEWDFERNVVSPETITRSFKKHKIWWKCEHNHSWEAFVTQRTRKKPSGCPYCSGNRPISGVNDFETANPELMKDWDFNKNNGLNPKELTANTGVYIDWKCHFCGYEWRTSGNNRSSLKRGCPNCSMKSTSFGEQAVFFYVKKLFPDSINRYRDGRFELDILIPKIKTAVEFDGAFFHNNEKSLEREKNKYKKCKELGIHLIRLKDSSTLNDTLYADQIFGIENLDNRKNLNDIIRILLREIDPASNKWTKTNPNQIWSTIDNLVDIEKDYYDILGDKYLREEQESFVHIKPDLLNDWDYDLNKQLNPKAITKAPSFKVNWKCHVCGYRWRARVQDRIRGDGCPCCNRTVLVEGVNDFATLFPQELEEWDYENNIIQPNKVVSNATKVTWRCKKCGFRWKTSIQDKVIRKDKTGCPECAKKSIAIKRHKKSMEGGGAFQKFPELLKSWDYEKNCEVDINDLSSGCNIKYHWKCPDCGYSWTASLANRTRGGKASNCPKCRYKLIDYSKFNKKRRK